MNANDVEIIVEHRPINKSPVVLFRQDHDNLDEFSVSKKYLNTVKIRSEIPKDSLVIGRYSVLPYYSELESDLHSNKSSLINDVRQHSFAANVHEYASLLYSLTPDTWERVEDIPMSEKGPFIVKGAINSRKNSWNTKMFAKDRNNLGRVIVTLLDDPLVAPQGLAIRKFIPLETLMVGINELPITNEHRIFVLNKRVVASGFYWANHVIDIQERFGRIPELDSFAWDLIYRAIQLIDTNCNFYTIDVAKTQEGDWIIIELNDGQMAGLSTIDPDSFYSRLRIILNG